MQKDEAKILLIDDNPKNLQVAMNILSKEGYSLIYAKDGEKGISLAQQDSFDLILLDILMPGMDGYVVCQKLKADPATRDIPIIFLTVKDEEADIVKGFECGAVDYVTKPFQVAVLLKRVETHLTLFYQTRMLKRLNEALHHEVDEQVEKIRLKDQILFQQSKMASMGEMIANIAHQWRQPLGAISAAVVGIKSRFMLGHFEHATQETFEECQEYLLKKCDDIEEYTRTLSSTIDDFRYFFKPQKRVETFVLGELVDKSIKLLKESFGDSDIEIINKVKDIKITGLRNELSQVLINLLHNAKDILQEQRDATGRVVLVEAKQREGRVDIYIQDSGGGVDEEIIEKIFEPYFSTKHQSSGTGLGLYMAREIIQKHMLGDISVENRSFIYDGVTYFGARFHIVLPDVLKEKFVHIVKD